MYNINSPKIIKKTFRDDNTIERIYSNGRRELVSPDRSSSIEIEGLSNEELKNLEEEVNRIFSKGDNELDLILKARKIAKNK